MAGWHDVGSRPHALLTRAERGYREMHGIEERDGSRANAGHDKPCSAGRNRRAGQRCVIVIVIVIVMCGL